MTPRDLNSVAELEPRATVVVSPRQESRTIVDLLLARAAEHRRWLAAVAIAAALISTLVAFLIPKHYQSVVRIMPPEGQNPAAMLAALSGKIPPGLSEMASGMLGIKNPGPLYVDLLRSRTILDDQVTNFDLQKVYWKRYRYQARKKLVSRTDVGEDRKSGVITIAVTDNDPARAKQLADAYVAELDKLLASVSTSAARRERIFIEHRLEGAKADLESAQVDFGNFASKNSTLDIKEQTKAMVTAAADLQGRIIAAESELQGVEQTYSENNIRVRSLRARITELKRQLAKISGSGDIQPNDAIAADSLYPSIRQLPILGVQWADLYRRAKIQETIYELLTQQYELAKIQEAREIPTVRVVDPADLPERKSWPPRVLFIVAGTLLGVLGFLGWEWCSIKWNQADETSRRRLNHCARIFTRQVNLH